MSDQPQAQHPHGLLGRLFGCLMERMNESAYRWVISALRETKPQSLYEIGFGTGRMLELASRELRLNRLRGVDPSALMLATARHRLRKHTKANVDLRLGDDTSNHWPEEEFDGVIALHSFQFWNEPEKTLRGLRARLSENGRLALVLRQHGKNPPDWLPNLLSRSGDEIPATLAALRSAGFAILGSETLDHASHGIVAA